MLQITIDYTHYAEILAQVLYAWHERAVATHKSLNAHTGTRSGVNLIDNILVGDVVYLNLHPCRTSLLSILYLGVE